MKGAESRREVNLFWFLVNVASGLCKVALNSWA